EEDSDTLEYFMTQVFEEYGVAHEEHSLRTLILRPSEHLREAHFPGLDEDGTTVTFDRQRSLSREDIAFMSWEHPMVVDSMDMIQSTELGNATLASMAIKGVNPGTVLLEAVYAVHCPAPRELQLTRYLPARPVRVLVDMQGRNLADKLDHERLNSLCEDIRRRTGPAIIAQVREVLESMLQRAERHAAETLPTQLGEANAALEAALGEEVQRLEALRRVNPSIREEEIRFFRQQMQHGREALGRAALQLQAMRVIVTT
ncbi:MAG: RNA polymerase-associated protein RapA, partial [Gammaproteobacteria bacterium]|nr:RNA polymerase-associated protein RapA [Gammaproteobacteria bacterium]